MMHQSVRSQSSSKHQPPAADELLRITAGLRPGLLLSPDGTIAAVNDRAAVLMGRSVDELTGSMFGAWASELDTKEIDLVRIHAGKATPSTVLAHRVAPEDGAGFVAVVLTELGHVAPRSQPVRSVLHAALATMEDWLPGPSLEVTHTKWPQVGIQPVGDEAILTGLRMLVSMAGESPARLGITAAHHADRQHVEVTLTLEALEPGEQSSAELDYAPFDTLLRGGGAVRLESEYPLTRLHIAIPE